MDIKKLQNKENEINLKIDRLAKRANDLLFLNRSAQGNRDTLQEAEGIDVMIEILTTKLFDVRWEIMLAKQK